MNTSPLIPFSAICVILFAHYIADFKLQTPWMAQNKSKSNFALTAHVATYCAVLFMICLASDSYLYFREHQNSIIQIFPNFGNFIKWVGLNSVIHWLVDFCTSRLSSKQFNKDWHKFFEIIGLDQWIHYWTLFYTYTVFFPLV